MVEPANRGSVPPKDHSDSSKKPKKKMDQDALFKERVTIPIHTEILSPEEVQKRKKKQENPIGPIPDLFKKTTEESR